MGMRFVVTSSAITENQPDVKNGRPGTGSFTKNSR